MKKFLQITFVLIIVLALFGLVLSYVATIAYAEDDPIDNFELFGYPAPVSDIGYPIDWYGYPAPGYPIIGYPIPEYPISEFDEFLEQKNSGELKNSTPGVEKFDPKTLMDNEKQKSNSKKTVIPELIHDSEIFIKNRVHQIGKILLRLR